MAIVEQNIGSKPLTMETLLTALNREAMPVLRRLREAVNARLGGYYADTIGDGAATSYTITHGLSSRDVVVQVYDAATYADVTPSSVVRTTPNAVTVTFGAPPAADSRRVVVRL